MIIVYSALIIVGFALCYLWVKLVFAVFGYIQRKRNSNPYINAEKLKIENDRNYEEYLKWMGKKGRTTPIAKITTPEEREANKKISELLR